MPQVIYDATKGLYQKSGTGFAMASETITADAATASAGIALTILDAASNDIDCTLPDGSVVGQLKWFVSIDANEYTLTPSSLLGAATKISFTEIGDTACLVWTGSAWAVLARANGAVSNASTFSGPAVES